MLTIRGLRQRLCEGISRRAFLQVGSLGALGLSLPNLLEANAQTDVNDASFGKAKRCLLLFLTGGPSQLDTWDLKPDAPVELRGELRPIATNVSGIQISELFPLLARQADKYCVVRSVTHNDGVHTSAGYTMLSGVYHPRPNLSSRMTGPKPNDHPHLGSMVAKARGWTAGLPPFVAMPEVIKDVGNEFSGLRAGFLGRRYDPWSVETNAKRSKLRIPDIDLPRDMTAGRLADRRVLLDQLNLRFDTISAHAKVSELEGFYDQAYSMISSPQARRAFELDREPLRVRESYGQHLFGQGCLLARRLLEAGVALVAVYWHRDGPSTSPMWDTHRDHYLHIRKRLMPPTDRIISQLLEDLAERGMLDETLVICMGEFGRTPKFNKNGGRDHWPGAQSIMLAGGGIRGGTVYGATDRTGSLPSERPVTPPDLTATFLHQLGIPPHLELPDLLGRAVPASSGTPIQGLFG